VIEAPRPALTIEEKHARRRRMFERHGVLRTLNKLAFNWLRSRYLSRDEGATVVEDLFPGGKPTVYLRGVPTVVVTDINDPTCVAAVQQASPDVIAVCGTSVIKPPVFSLAPRGAVNIHTGITPEYRSADPIFWALYHGEPQQVGVTIHFVDQGIDTGPIIHQERVPLFADDSMARIYVRCIRRGAELYLRALNEIADGSVRTHNRSGVVGRAFYSINLGIVQYLIFLLRFHRLKRSLPRPVAGPDNLRAQP